MKGEGNHAERKRVRRPREETDTADRLSVAGKEETQKEGGDTNAREKM